jgi:YVTN family beta-propeller protein
VGAADRDQHQTNMIYVVNTHANGVSVIDGRTNTVVATVPADKGPWAVAVNPVSNMIYVANRLSDKVTVIDGRTNKSVQR